MASINLMFFMFLLQNHYSVIVIEYDIDPVVGQELPVGKAAP